MNLNELRALVEVGDLGSVKAGRSGWRAFRKSMGRDPTVKAVWDLNVGLARSAGVEIEQMTLRAGATAR